MIAVVQLFCYSIILLFSCSNVYGQKLDVDFRRPLDIPVSLSGSFGELRDNHFHSGIDYRTQGTTGHKVFACEQGYVSRISVSAFGYGKALYITHPNGYTTVYGHLDAFNTEIDEYLKQQQYEQERFSLNLFPDASLLPVKRGDLIAFSGNTGGSGGPHLHFEVRDTESEEPINPFLFGLGIKDNVPPVMQQIAIYPIGAGSTLNGQTEKIVFDLEKSGNAYRIVGNVKLKIVGKVAFGVNTFDNISGSANRCGTYNIRLWIDSVMMFSQTMDRFSFDESRYINSLIDYGYYVQNKARFNRLFLEPNNRLNVYDKHINRGIISFPDSARCKVLVIVSDFHGNSSRLTFSFDYQPLAKSQITIPNLHESYPFPEPHEQMYKKELIREHQGIRVVIPADALYDNIDFRLSASTTIPKGLYSKSYKIHKQFTPLHKAITIEISADELPERLREKALIVQIETNARRSSMGGVYQDGTVRTSSRVFGDFAIGVDTVPPRITPVNIKNGANMTGAKNIRIKISDDFSGINTYNGWIDGQWALFEYDAKNSLLFYDFDDNRLTKNTQHTLKLNVTDGKGNIAEYEASFVW